MWRPSASLEHLQLRGRVLAVLRTFFAQRGVWEIDTPLLDQSTATDPFIGSFSVQPVGATQSPVGYLQTSPEFAMKRLLAAGSGSIYQICKAFRCEERGRWHNPEFTLLEWYRVGFDHHQLMDEMDALLHAVLGVQAAERVTYAQLFQRYLDIDPHHSTVAALQSCAHERGIALVGQHEEENLDFWRNLLLAQCIEPQLGHDRPVFISDFPVSQAALARIRPGNPAVAERFEVYVQGVELANGYHELTDAVEQRRRFEADNAARRQLGLAQIPVDERLLAALTVGMPPCAGVALGVDRLVMLAARAQRVEEVISFVSSSE